MSIFRVVVKFDGQRTRLSYAATSDGLH